MTRDQSRLLDAVATTRAAAERLRDSLRMDGAELAAAIALSPQGEPGALREVDAFVHRYQQAVEHVTHRLFGAIYRAEELGNRPPPLTGLFAFIESVGVLNTAQPWKVYLEIRNRLVHEYPLDAVERAQELKGAAEASHAILADIDILFAYIGRRKLLETSDDH